MFLEQTRTLIRANKSQSQELLIKKLSCLIRQWWFFLNYYPLYSDNVSAALFEKKPREGSRSRRGKRGLKKFSSNLKSKGENFFVKGPFRFLTLKNFKFQKMLFLKFKVKRKAFFEIPSGNNAPPFFASLCFKNLRFLPLFYKVKNRREPLPVKNRKGGQKQDPLEKKNTTLQRACFAAPRKKYEKKNTRVEGLAKVLKKSSSFDLKNFSELKREHFLKPLIYIKGLQKMFFFLLLIKSRTFCENPSPSGKKGCFACQKPRNNVKKTNPKHFKCKHFLESRYFLNPLLRPFQKMLCIFWKGPFVPCFFPYKILKFYFLPTAFGKLPTGVRRKKQSSPLYPKGKGFARKAKLKNKSLKFLNVKRRSSAKKNMSGKATHVFFRRASLEKRRFLTGSQKTLFENLKIFKVTNRSTKYKGAGKGSVFFKPFQKKPRAFFYKGHGVFHTSIDETQSLTNKKGQFDIISIPSPSLFFFCFFSFNPQINSRRFSGAYAGFAPWGASRKVGVLRLGGLAKVLKKCSSFELKVKHFLKPLIYIKGQNPSPSGKKGCFAFLHTNFECKTFKIFKGQKLLQKSKFFFKGSSKIFLVKNRSPKFKGVLRSNFFGQQRRDEKYSAFFKPFQKKPRASFDKGPQAIEKAPFGHPSFLFFLRANQNYTDSIIFKMLWKWTCKRHPKKNNKWLLKQYFFKINGRNWVFATLGSGKQLKKRSSFDFKLKEKRFLNPFWWGSFLATKGPEGKKRFSFNLKSKEERFLNPPSLLPSAFVLQSKNSKGAIQKFYVLHSKFGCKNSKKGGKVTSPFCSSIFRTKAQFYLGSFFISKHNKLNWVQLLPIYYFTNYKDLIPVLKEKTRFDYYITIPKHSEITVTHYKKTKKKYAPKQLYEQVNDLLFWSCRASKTYNGPLLKGPRL